MVKFLRILAWLAIIAIIVIAAIIFVPQKRTSAEDLAVNADWLPAAHDDTGEYAARAGDCAACHTAEGGVPFAGGRPIESPFGAIYSSNITPDKETGIGDWTLDQFRAALVDGIDEHGANLYPAMPYANYRKLSERDIEGLYTYFHDTLEPVKNEVEETSLTFPFNQRWGIRVWKWVGLPDAGFTPRYDDADLNLGAYLVEGPGHCAACHSPRNLVFAQNGTDAQSDSFLTGGEIAGWAAPDLRTKSSSLASWSAQDLDLFLATGRNAHAGVTGEMKLAIEDSLQYLTDKDRGAMVKYLQHIAEYDAPKDATLPAAVTAYPERLDMSNPTDTEKLLLTPQDQPLGARLYMDNCAACHFVNGQGADEVFPALDGNGTVTADATTGLIDTILHGASMPSTQMRPMTLAMPGFGDRLSDDEVAALASFVRSAWGNDAPAVKADAVRALR
ncbi:cytochrome c [Rhodobacteraceae bacterium]|nr:cytochrome c [Paracoccaceae bacterium]